MSTYHRGTCGQEIEEIQEGHYWVPKLGLVAVLSFLARLLKKRRRKEDTPAAVHVAAAMPAAVVDDLTPQERQYLLNAVTRMSIAARSLRARAKKKDSSNGEK